MWLRSQSALLDDIMPFPRELHVPEDLEPFPWVP